MREGCVMLLHIFTIVAKHLLLKTEVFVYPWEIMSLAMVAHLQMDLPVFQITGTAILV